LVSEGGVERGLKVLGVLAAASELPRQRLVVDVPPVELAAAERGEQHRERDRDQQQPGGDAASLPDEEAEGDDEQAPRPDERPAREVDRGGAEYLADQLLQPSLNFLGLPHPAPWLKRFAAPLKATPAMLPEGPDRRRRISGRGRARSRGRWRRR
jgi:hypothetical protein